ncbi:MAG: ACP phosphodiesterase [Pseudomonadota bacterium]
MNFLAHAFLSRRSADLIVGGFLGEFHRGRIDSAPARYRDGIWLHRKVDSFTDRDATTGASRQLFESRRRRMAGIALDLLYDHFLHRHWSNFSTEALPVFAARANRALQDAGAQHPEVFVPRAARVLRLLLDEGWFEAYGRVSHLQATFARVATRAHWLAPLADAWVDIEPNYRELEQRFLEFFPRLHDYSSALLVARDGDAT